MKRTNKNPLIVISIILLILFLIILIDILTTKQITKLDILVYKNISQIQTPILTKIFIFITNFGATIPLIILTILLSLILLIRKKYSHLILLISSMLIGVILELSIKILVHRLRPEHALIPITKYSFPSGHATMAIIFFSILSYSIVEHIKNKTKILWFSLLSFCLATVPFLNVRFENSSDEGERYGFLVSVFFVIFLAQFLYSIFGNLKYKKYFYFGLITLFVIFSFFIHFEKGKLWQKSADLRDSMLTQFANNLDKSKNNYFIFLSFPDNFSGTQLTRNAVLEMFKLENNFFSMSGERVTMYSLPNKSNYQEKIVSFSRDLDIVRLQPVREDIGKVLSGTGHYYSEYFNAIFDSKNIEVSLKRVQIDKSPYDMTLVYFDGQKLNFVPLN